MEQDGPEQGLIDMMRRIYTETVVEHVLNPRNIGNLPDADGYGTITTPDGDTVRVWLRVKDNLVTDASFWTNACAATIASLSMVTDLARGKTPADALAVGQQDVLDALGGLPEGNVHCAALAVSALREAVKDYLVMKREPWKRSYRKYA